MICFELLYFIDYCKKHGFRMVSDRNSILQIVQKTYEFRQNTYESSQKAYEYTFMCVLLLPFDVFVINT